jgi:hypothetical protein
MSPNYMDFFLVSKGNLVCGPMPVQIKFFLGEITAISAPFIVIPTPLVRK